MTDQPCTARTAPARTAPVKPPVTKPAAPSQAETLAAQLGAAARKPVATTARAAATGVAAMPKAWHDDQAKQRAADTRFDGSRFRRK